MDDIRFDELFSGDVENLVELPKRVVRLFISSTFTDMTLERNTLMERVYPRLKKYCRERHGLDFQVVDMRWGVRDEATDDHQTASLCSREIDNCQRMSLGPNFVALVGDKYGFRPLSNKIKSTEYRSLRQALIQLDINTDFLDVWYREDTNAIPAEYLLQPISSILKNFTNKSEPDLQSIDQRIWFAIQDRLHELLLSGSRELVSQGRMSLEEQLMKYSISVTEREIIEGCLDVKEAKSHCLVFIRNIVDLRYHMDDCLAKLSPIWSQQLSATNGGEQASEGRRGRRDSQTRRASLKIGDDVISLNTSCAMNASERRLERQRKLIGRYIDMRSTKDNMWQLDEEAQEALATLRDIKLINKMVRADAKMQNLTKFRITWDEQDGVSLKCEEHKQYLNDLSEHFYNNLTRMIRRASKNEEHAFVKSSGLVNEMLQHSHYAKHVSHGFHGRSRELDKIRAYIMGDSDLSSKPMFLYGVGGSGKTSLMAKAATLAKDWILRVKLQAQQQSSQQTSSTTTATSNASNKLDSTSAPGNASGGVRWNHRPCVIMRFCCTTPSSSSMLDVLSSVARQLQYHFYQYGPLSGQSQQHDQHLTTMANVKRSINTINVNDNKPLKFNLAESNSKSLAVDGSSTQQNQQSANTTLQTTTTTSLMGDNSASSIFGSQLAYQRLPEDFVQLVFSFRQLLDNCRHSLHEKRLFIIILDSIERLTTPAQMGVEVKYSWLTSIARLPPNVRLIVSCSSEQSHGHDHASYVHLKRHFLQSHFIQIRQLLRQEAIKEASTRVNDRNHHKQISFDKLRLKSLASLSTSRLPWIIHVKPLGVDLATEVVRHWLKEKGRSLSVQQWAMVERCFSHCSRPIFVKLAFDEVLNWRSYSMQSDAKGLTFGSSLVGTNKNQLLATYSINDPVLASLAAHCGSDFDDFCESDQMKLQILTMEQEWLNYYDHNQRKEQIVQSNGNKQSELQQHNSDKINSKSASNKQQVSQNYQMKASSKKHSHEIIGDSDKQQRIDTSGNVLIKIDTMMSSSGGSKSNSYASSVSASHCHLSNTIDDAICQLFARIELQHGFVLTKHSLSYLTIARNGICENELEDVLSLDDVVLDDVFQYHFPPVRRIPPLLWTRIRNDLPDYLSERDADGIVINWHHGQFRRVTEARYLTDKQQLVYFHSILADYFLGRWADKAKPFRCTRQQIQMAAEQLDSALQQSARDSQSGARGSGAEGGGSGSVTETGAAINGSRGGGGGVATKAVSRAGPIGSGSIQRPRTSVAGSIGRLTGQRSGSIRSGSSFAVRNRLRGSEMNDSRLQSMQAKADRRVPQQPLYYLIDTSSNHDGHNQTSTDSAHDGTTLADPNNNQWQQPTNNTQESVTQNTGHLATSGSYEATTKRRYNLRKLTELPYHLIRAGRFLDLAQGVLFNYDWLSAALEALGLQSLLADFEDAIRGLQISLNDLEPKFGGDSLPAGQGSQMQYLTGDYAGTSTTRSMIINYGLMGDQLAELADQSLNAELLRQMINQLRKLEGTIRLSCSVLHTDPKMLAPQLIGRLISLIQPNIGAPTTVPVNISNKWLTQLLEQCDKHGCSECSLLPTDQCLQSPDGMQSSSLEGHLFGITSMSMGADKRHLLAVSNRFIMWDTSTGQISREVNPLLEASIMRQVEMGYNSEFAIAYTSNDLILALDILTQQVVSYNLPVSASNAAEQDPISGLSLIDRFGASRFVVWNRSSWFVMRILNNELDQSVTMRQRISLELVYQLNLSQIPGADNRWLRIVSVRCGKQQQALLTKKRSVTKNSLVMEDIERELSFVQVESIDGNKLEMITLSCPLNGSRKVCSSPSTTKHHGEHIEIWNPVYRKFQASAMALDGHCKQLIFSDLMGNIFLSRRRACSWSRAKLLMSAERGQQQITRQESRANHYNENDRHNYPNIDHVPLCIELDSPDPSKADLESLLLLDDNLDLNELVSFERRVEDLVDDHELDGEIESEPVFKSQQRQQQSDNNSNSDDATSNISTGVQLIRLYYGSQIILLQLTRNNSKSNSQKVTTCQEPVKYVINFPKEVQNVSIELGQCQVHAVCLGCPVKFLVASAGKRLLFFSLEKQTLLRSIEAHSERIVQLISINNQGNDDNSGCRSGGLNGQLEMSVASASIDKTVKIWTLSNVDKPDELIQKLSDRIEHLSILSNGQVPLAACLTRTGQLGLFNWATLKLVHSRLGYRGEPDANARLELTANSKIFQARFSPNGQFLCVATQFSINLYTFENFQTKPLGTGTANFNQLNLKLHSKLPLVSASSQETTGIKISKSNQIVRKLKFVLQDSRILTILESLYTIRNYPNNDSNLDAVERNKQSTLHESYQQIEQNSYQTSEDLNETAMSSPESAMTGSSSTNSSSRSGSVIKFETIESGSRLLVLCHSLSDSRLVYKLELNPLGSWPAKSSPVQINPNNRGRGAINPKSNATTSNSNGKHHSKSDKNLKNRQPIEQERSNKLNIIGNGKSRTRIGPLPVVTKDRLHLIVLESSGASDNSENLTTDFPPGRYLKVYSTRDGVLVRAINLDRLEMGLAPEELVASNNNQRQLQQSMTTLNSNQRKTPLIAKSVSISTSIARNPLTNLLSSATPAGISSFTPTSSNPNLAPAPASLDRPTVSLMNEPVTKLRALVYRDRATVVALIDEESGTSHLVDVNSRQLLISSSLWNGKLSSDGRFGLTRFFRTTATNAGRGLLVGRLTGQQQNQPSYNTINHQKRFILNQANQQQQLQSKQQTTVATQSGLIGAGSGLELLEMRRMSTLHSLLSGRDLARLGGRSEFLVSGGGSGLGDQEVQCGFSKPNDQYVYYYDPRLTCLLLIRLRDSKLMANYRLSAPVTQIKCSPDGLALILAHSDGSLCTLAIADPEKNDTLVRLAQYPSRRQMASR